MAGSGRLAHRSQPDKRQRQERSVQTDQPHAAYGDKAGLFRAVADVSAEPSQLLAELERGSARREGLGTHRRRHLRGALVTGQDRGVVERALVGELLREPNAD